MPRHSVRAISLWCLLGTSGCVHGTTKYYENKGEPNVRISYNGVFEFPYSKTIWIDLTRESSPCHEEYLGILQGGDSHGVRVPTGKPLTIEAVFLSSSLLGPGGKSKSVPFRFIPHDGVNYLFEIIDTGRSQGFEVYKVDALGMKKTAVSYLPARACGR